MSLAGRDKEASVLESSPAGTQTSVFSPYPSATVSRATDSGTPLLVIDTVAEVKSAAGEEKDHRA